MPTGHFRSTVWSDRLAADALALEPGAAQRFAVLGTHALDNIAGVVGITPSINSDRGNFSTPT
jgi:hypothetical protein